MISDSAPLIVSGLPEAPQRVDAVAGVQDVPVIVLEALGLRVPRISLFDGGRPGTAMCVALEARPAGVGPSPVPVGQETADSACVAPPTGAAGPEICR